MKINQCSSAELKNYISFCKEIYKNDKNYRDSLTDILEMILFKKGEFCKNAEITPLVIAQGDDFDYKRFKQDFWSSVNSEYNNMDDESSYFHNTEYEKLEDALISYAAKLKDN